MANTPKGLEGVQRCQAVQVDDNGSCVCAAYASLLPEFSFPEGIPEGGERIRMTDLCQAVPDTAGGPYPRGGSLIASPTKAPRRLSADAIDFIRKKFGSAFYIPKDGSPEARDREEATIQKLKKKAERKLTKGGSKPPRNPTVAQMRAEVRRQRAAEIIAEENERRENELIAARGGVPVLPMPPSSAVDPDEIVKGLVPGRRQEIRALQQDLQEVQRDFGQHLIAALGKDRSLDNLVVLEKFMNKLFDKVGAPKVVLKRVPKEGFKIFVEESKTDVPVDAAQSINQLKASLVRAARRPDGTIPPTWFKGMLRKITKDKTVDDIIQLIKKSPAGENLSGGEDMLKETMPVDGEFDGLSDLGGVTDAFRVGGTLRDRDFWMTHVVTASSAAATSIVFSKLLEWNTVANFLTGKAWWVRDLVLFGVGSIGAGVLLEMARTSPSRAALYGQLANGVMGATGIVVGLDVLGKLNVGGGAAAMSGVTIGNEFAQLPEEELLGLGTSVEVEDPLAAVAIEDDTLNGAGLAAVLASVA